MLNFQTIRDSWSGVKGHFAIVLPSQYWDKNNIRSNRISSSDKYKKTPKSEPHMTLSDPFVCYDHFEEIERKMTEILMNFQPFDIHFREIDHFTHKKKRATLFAKPETDLVNGVDPLKMLMKEVFYITADELLIMNSITEDTTLHLSLGKYPHDEIEAVKEQTQNNWEAFFIYFK